MHIVQKMDFCAMYILDFYLIIKGKINRKPFPHLLFFHSLYVVACCFCFYIYFILSFASKYTKLCAMMHKSNSFVISFHQA